MDQTLVTCFVPTCPCLVVEKWPYCAAHNAMGRNTLERVVREARAYLKQDIDKPIPWNEYPYGTQHT